ncbi:hypothetical protein [Labilibacter marinus]|uniref:hypothetical protein n=1 Tax=Labilibacter marinus TaxID=1477105 RepID=UPI000831BE30|nr:hypothetical protein [Labilibacter marinus]
MNRRKFIQNIALGGMVCGISLPGLFQSCTSKEKDSDEFLDLVSGLLKEWCDGMVKNQIIKPDNLAEHGALGCPSCGFIHGRCMDAVYPFMYMADTTGDKKYLDAAILVMNWAENNVSQEDGSWTVIPNPKSWRGISVFGAIALGEALHYHGHLLEEELKNKWYKRLDEVGAYLHRTFTMTFTNVNYGFTAVYAMNLLGKVLNKPKYTQRSHELAKDVKNFFTEPNKLLFGEGKPSTKKSAKGLSFVDLGYNVEESLNGPLMYAIHENDEEMLALLSQSMESHLEFMLPDGAWDNSWGTRQAKWSYWGSRTTDGSQVTYGIMAKHNPVFGTAAVKNTELLKRCTADGLLHGGPHYISHGVKPCIHHTFAHAKPLATILDMAKEFSHINGNTPLPRTKSYGVKEFPEVSTWLFSSNNWRGTVTSYDAIYKEHVQQATGGSLAVLYHNKVGTLFAASMAKYKMVEKNNMQPLPGEDFALTPRIESYKDDKWYTNLFDLEAKVNVEDENEKIVFDVEASLRDEDRNMIVDTASTFDISYACTKDKIVLSAKPIEGQEIKQKSAMVLPLLSPSGEKLTQVSPQLIEVQKQEGKVVLESNVPLIIKKTDKGRVFNMVPGAEAVPIIAYFTKEVSEVICTIRVI